MWLASAFQSMPKQHEGPAAAEQCRRGQRRLSSTLVQAVHCQLFTGGLPSQRGRPWSALLIHAMQSFVFPAVPGVLLHQLPFSTHCRVACCVTSGRLSCSPARNDLLLCLKTLRRSRVTPLNRFSRGLLYSCLVRGFFSSYFFADRRRVADN